MISLKASISKLLVVNEKNKNIKQKYQTIQLHNNIGIIVRKKYGDVIHPVNNIAPSVL